MQVTPQRLAAHRKIEPNTVRQDLAERDYEPGQLLVSLKDDAELRSTLAGHGLTATQQYRDIVLVELTPDQDMAEVLSDLRQDQRVDAADVNERYSLFEDEPSPNDLDPRQWALENTGQSGGTPGADIGAREGWEITTGNGEDGPIIAILDTGMDLDHPDLRNNLWTNPQEIAGNGLDDDGNGIVDDIHGYNAYDNNGDPSDGHSHGTHVAGIIAAEGNNDLGIVGVNWQARLMPIKIFSDAGSTTADTIVRGVFYAEDHGATIANNSWGGGYNEVLAKVFEESPMLHVSAAGNNGRNTDLGPLYPAGYRGNHIVSVAATDHNDERAEFSNYGKFQTDVAAPGQDILSTVPDDYGFKSGTSMATPHVTGAAGLIASQFPEATPGQVRARLIYNSELDPKLTEVSNSGGRIDLAKSLETDTIPPAVPNDLRMTDLNPETFNLQWTVPGDDGWCGQAASAFELKVSTDPILTQEQFEELPNRTNLPNRLAVGELYQLNQFRPASSEDLTLHVGLRAIDNVGNKSEISTREIVIPGFTTLYENDMDSEESGWTGDGSWAQEKAPGRGLVWSDSPGHDYDNNSNTSLVSPFVDLKGFGAPTMELEYKVDLAPGDALFVEASEDGEDWVGISQVWAQDRDFRATRFDMSHLEDKKVQFRFRLVTDGGGTRSGVSVDTIRIIGARLPADG